MSDTGPCGECRWCCDVTCEGEEPEQDWAVLSFVKRFYGICHVPEEQPCLVKRSEDVRCRYWEEGSE